MARAQDAGFSSTRYYHGRTHKFDEFANPTDTSGWRSYDNPAWRFEPEGHHGGCMVRDAGGCLVRPQLAFVSMAMLTAPPATAYRCCDIETPGGGDNSFILGDDNGESLLRVRVPLGAPEESQRGKS